jgi:hypothetical protein
MKKLSFFIFITLFSGCSLIQAHKEQIKRDHDYITTLICTSHKRYQKLEANCFRSKDPIENCQESFAKEALKLQKYLAYYEHEYEEKFNWKECKRSKK